MLGLRVNLRQDVVELGLNSVKFAVNLVQRDFFSAYEEAPSSFPSPPLPPYLDLIFDIRSAT